jgi:threonine aldolase
MRRADFASDNTSGVCPEALDALLRANDDAVPAYGNDSWTAQASEAFRVLFEIDCEVFFVFNGTAANSLALASLCQPFHSVIAHEHAHVETDECGAPEFFSNGSKLLLGDGLMGKLSPTAVAHLVGKRHDIHYPKPKVVSVTQATELGTVYTPDELDALRTVARQHGLRIHMDGARFANALASLGATPAELTWKRGVDVLCFCGTKNGLPMGEAIVFFDRELARDFAYRCKQAGQLASKMRYITAPWLALIDSGAYLRNARHANDCARRLAQGLERLDGVRLMFPQEANSVFVELPEGVDETLRARGWDFYSFIGVGGARFMCSWATTDELVDELVTDVELCVARIGDLTRTGRALRTRASS